MDEVFATRPLREWCALFDERGFIWGPASTVDEFAADEQAAADGLFPEIDDGDGRRFRTVRAPMRVQGADVAPRGPAPAVGEHTPAVLAELGVPAEELAALAGDGVIGPAGSDRRASAGVGEERAQPRRPAEGPPAVAGLRQPVGDEPQHRGVEPHAEVAACTATFSLRGPGCCRQARQSTTPSQRE